jgi:ATP-dependent exoDNAse (exonuclease V) alpha subunit
MDDGHCGLPTDVLLSLAERLLEVPVELVRTALDLERADGTVVADTVGETACVFLAGLHRAERYIADRLLGLSGGSLPWPWIDPDKALPWIAERLKIIFAESQTVAIRQALACKVLVITGGPGVGKTTIVKAILRILSAKGVKLLLCAPTGRAAKRMTEATGIEAKTIHRLLEADPQGGGFKRGDENPLDCDLLVVDDSDRRCRQLFAELVRERTFYELDRRLSPSVKSALVEFVRALAKIGKGTGITAGQHRRTAREAMARCYDAVPCWIMPTWRVAEQLPADLGALDLVIIDEASQSDVTELPTLLRGRKILVVGDDRQVSPTAPFITQAKIAQLRHHYLGELPFKNLLEPGESIYDLSGRCSRMIG